MTSPAPKPQEWQSAYAGVQRIADREVLEAIQHGLTDLNRTLAELRRRERLRLFTFSDGVRREQLQVVKRALLRAQGEVFRRTGDIAAARRVEAAARAVKLGSAIDSIAFAAAGRGDIGTALATSLRTGLEQTVETAVTRMTQSAVPLSERVYKNQVWMDGRVQKLVNSALIRGLSARDFAAEARDWISPATPGGIRYAAMRLARSEINNAFHATAVNNAVEKPWVNAMKWHLSGSHRKADECNRIASGGLKSDGVYKPENVPKKPHPNCFCYVTPVVDDEDKFLDDLIAGKHDAYLESKIPAYRGLERGIPTAPKAPAPPKKRATPKPKPAPQPAPPKPAPQPKRAVPTSIPGFSLGRISKNIPTELQDSAIRAAAATEAKVGVNVNRVRSVDPHTKGRSTTGMEQAFDKGAYAACQSGTIEVHPHLHLQRASVASCEDMGWFVRSSSNGAIDEFDRVMAHEMGHALTTEYFHPDELSELFDMVGTTLGMTRRVRLLYPTDVGGFNSWLNIGDNRKIVAEKVSQYGTQSPAEFMAEVWSAYALDAGASAEIKAIGKKIEDLVRGF